jgi:hypothetical protein
MPINACGADPCASFEPNICEPDEEPLHRAAPSRAVANGEDLAPFVQLDHGLTSNQETGKVYAHAALLSGHDPNTGLDLEVLSVAAQAGPRAASVEGVFERFGFSSADGTKSIHADLLSATAELRTHNSDESNGIGLGASASSIGVELTLGGGGDNSFTVGAGVGVGAHASVGLRDIDNDGKAEICARFGVTLFTIAGCVETPF